MELESGKVAHLGNTYARMEYLESLRARHGAQETAEDCSTDLSMSRGPSRACNNDGACVSDEAFEEAGPTLYARATPTDDACDDMAGLIGSYRGTLGDLGAHEDSAPPITVRARSQRRDPLPTIAVDIPEAADHDPGPGPSPSWGVPPSRSQCREPLATIAVDVPEG